MSRYKTQKLTVYNSLSGQKEVFQPLQEGHVGLYVCGPTVYSNVHLGNCRTFISFDMMFRYLQHLDYKVRYVRNITDVGHLENDADDGEDKIAKKAKLEQLEPMEIVQRYTVDFHQTLQKFNVLPPSIEPTATGHIIEQIDAVKRILRKGFAYEVNGSVYFDVIRFNKQHTYGKLSGRNPEDMLANTRALTAQDEKRNPQDFALWKKASPQHLMRWPSPWGEGFPGWHLECTTMSTKYLGDTFDIHGGGMDLKFPHHDCEIAQSEAGTGTSPATYWLHANMLTLNGRKMAKSTGNHLSPSEVISGENNLLSKAYAPAVVRFFMMQAHYAGVLDLSDAALQASEKGYHRLMEAMAIVDTLTSGSTSDFDVNAWQQQCYDAMNDDFNTPILIAQLFEGVKHVNRVKIGEASLTQSDITLLRNTLHTFVYEILGLKRSNGVQKHNNKLGEVVQLLIDLRNTARDKKDFATSDHIRDELATLGIQLKDGKAGTTFHVE